jgi:formate dehydrogenase accessory protein FdhD
MGPVASVDVIRVRGGERTVAADSTAAQEPLEVRLHDRPFARTRRTSFEIVQKAWFGIPVLVAVSAPSSLAVSVAREAGITLVGFVLDGAFNIYAHEQRIHS